MSRRGKVSGDRRTLLWEKLKLLGWSRWTFLTVVSGGGVSAVLNACGALWLGAKVKTVTSVGERKHLGADMQEEPYEYAI